MTQRYPLLMRSFHWLMAVIIIALLGVGLWMEGLPNDYPNKYTYYGWHKSFGVIALVLVVLRIVNRIKSTLPPEAEGLKPWEKLAASAGHYGLYFCMVAMPISGIVMSQAGGHGVKVFGVALPNVVAKDKELSGLANALHGWVAYALIALLVLHIGAVLKHKFIDRHDVLPRMGVGS